MDMQSSTVPDRVAAACGLSPSCWFVSLFCQLPIPIEKTTKDQETGNSNMRPHIERTARSGFVVWREARVQRGRNRHHAGMDQSSNRIRVRVAGIEEPKNEAACGSCGNQADCNMAPKSL